MSDGRCLLGHETMLVEDCRECDGCSPDEREGSNRPSGESPLGKRRLDGRKAEDESWKQNVEGEIRVDR